MKRSSCNTYMQMIELYNKALLYNCPNTMVKLVVAYSANTKGIGYNGSLPWSKIPQDVKSFVNITTSISDDAKFNVVIMGRVTWESLPDNAKPLKDRFNIVVTSSDSFICDMDEQYNDVRCVNSLQSAIALAESLPFIDDVFVIGGEQLYNEAILRNDCTDIYVTEIYKDYSCDRFFPSIPTWMLLDKDHIRVAYNKHHDMPLVFKHYVNKSLLFDRYSGEYQYLDVLRNILENGEDTDDRTDVGTLSVFDVNMSFDVTVVNPYSFHEQEYWYRVPIMTTKSLHVKSVVLELIWFLNGNTNSKWLSDRGVRIWNGNTSKETLDKLGLDYEEGELGPGYGHQWIHWGKDFQSDDSYQGINQIKNIISLLRSNPTSRRAVLSAWNVSDLDKMALPPCHVMYMFKITNHKGTDKPKLNCKLVMRSNDMFLGSPFNILSCTILTILISRALEIHPGKVSISISDAHIYKNHISQVNEQLKRTPYKFPLLQINADVCNWESMKSLTYNDFKLFEYNHWPAIKADMVV